MFDHKADLSGRCPYCCHYSADHRKDHNKQDHVRHKTAQRSLLYQIHHAHIYQPQYYKRQCTDTSQFAQHSRLFLFFSGIHTKSPLSYVLFTYFIRKSGFAKAQKTKETRGSCLRSLFDCPLFLSLFVLLIRFFVCLVHNSLFRLFYCRDRSSLHRNTAVLVVTKFNDHCVI